MAKTNQFLISFLPFYPILFCFCAHNKTPLREIRATLPLRKPYFFTGYSSIKFFDSYPFLNTADQATFGNLQLTMQHLCDIRKTMHCISHQVFLIQPLPSENKVVPRGGKFPKHLPLSTCLAHFPQKCFNFKVLLVVSTFAFLNLRDLTVVM